MTEKRVTTLKTRHMTVLSGLWDRYNEFNLLELYETSVNTWIQL